MKKIPMFLVGILLLGIFLGFQMSTSKPKAAQKYFLNNNIGYAKEKNMAVLKPLNEEEPSFLVHYQTKGNNLFVECIVTGISFRELDRSQQKVGKMLVWVDGKKKLEVSTAAFILKGLANGNHQLKLEMINLQNKPYGLSKEFKVNIHKD